MELKQKASNCDEEMWKRSLSQKDSAKGIEGNSTIVIVVLNAERTLMGL